MDEQPSLMPTDLDFDNSSAAGTLPVLPAAAENPESKCGDKPVKKWVLIVCGLVIGIINGFFGGGGGMIAVPILTKIVKLPTKTAHATAILIILPISLVSALVYIFCGYFEIPAGFYAGAGVVAGGLTGAYLLSKLKNDFIKILFDLLMIAAGVKMLFF